METDECPRDSDESIGDIPHAGRTGRLAAKPAATITVEPKTDDDADCKNDESSSPCPS